MVTTTKSFEVIIGMLLEKAAKKYLSTAQACFEEPITMFFLVRIGSLFHY
jgi:hypothetical protein